MVVTTNRPATRECIYAPESKNADIYQNAVATNRPTAMQSTNTTQNRNLIKLTNGNFNTTANPMDDTENK